MSTRTHLTPPQADAIERKFIEAEEDALCEFQYLLFDLMEQQGINKADLAQRLGISRARMSQIFSNKANPTLKSAARCIAAAGSGLKLAAVKAPTHAPLKSPKGNPKETVAIVKVILNACITENWSGSEETPNGDNENFAPKEQVA